MFPATIGGMNKTAKPLQIFKPGKHTAMSGATLEFTEAHLEATAKAYDPKLWRAPLVTGHPKHDDPAYGWVDALAYAEGELNAAPGDVDPTFAEWVKAKRYANISASFYSPDSPQNPVPGVYYLRHVGFLGAQPPAIKGMRPPEFAANEEGVVTIEFGDFAGRMTASALRRLRDWVIGKFGLEEADKAIPDYTIATLEDEARRDEPTATARPASFGEGNPAPTPQGDTSPMSEEEKKRLADLEAENARLKDAAAKAELAKQKAEFGEYLAGEIKAGRLLPAEKDNALAFMETVATAPATVEFGEGEKKTNALGWFKQFVSGLPKRVEFSEVAKPDTAPASTTHFAAPNGMTVNQEKLELHAKALAYQESNPGTDYVTAVIKVGG